MSSCQCPVKHCNKVSRRQDLLRHFGMHVPVSEACLICGKEFTRASQFIRHLRHHKLSNFPDKEILMNSTATNLRDQIASEYSDMLGQISFIPASLSNTNQPLPLLTQSPVNNFVLDEPRLDSDAVGSDAVGSDTVGPDTVGSEAVGSEAVGSEVVGSDAVGSDAVGSDAVVCEALVTTGGNRDAFNLASPYFFPLNTNPLLSRPLIAEKCVFEKWNVQDYAFKLQWFGVYQLPAIGSETALSLYHFSAGPRFPVSAISFQASDPEHTQLWGKSGSGWKSFNTVAYRLVSYGDVITYIQSSIECCIMEFKDELMLCLWNLHISGNYKLLSQALELWAAYRLLMLGWQCDQSKVVYDIGSLFFGRQPAPRVLQNQMDQQLEAFIAKREHKIACYIQNHLSGTSYSADVFVCLLVLLTVLEKDIWRLMYWTRYISNDYKWRHPLSAKELISNNIWYARNLLEYIKGLGMVPRELLAFASQTPQKFIEDSSYDSTNDRSLDFTLVKYGFLPIEDGENLTLHRVLSL